MQKSSIALLLLLLIPGMACAMDNGKKPVAGRGRGNGATRSKKRGQAWRRKLNDGNKAPEAEPPQCNLTIETVRQELPKMKVAELEYLRSLAEAQPGDKVKLGRETIQVGALFPYHQLKEDINNELEIRQQMTSMPNPNSKPGNNHRRVKSVYDQLIEQLKPAETNGTTADTAHKPEPDQSTSDTEAPQAPRQLPIPPVKPDHLVPPATEVQPETAEPEPEQVAAVENGTPKDDFIFTLEESKHVDYPPDQVVVVDSQTPYGQQSAYAAGEVGQGQTEELSDDSDDEFSYFEDTQNIPIVSEDKYTPAYPTSTKDFKALGNFSSEEEGDSTTPVPTDDKEDDSTTNVPVPTTTTSMETSDTTEHPDQLSGDESTDESDHDLADIAGEQSDNESQHEPSPQLTSTEATAATADQSPVAEARTESVPHDATSSSPDQHTLKYTPLRIPVAPQQVSGWRKLLGYVLPFYNPEYPCQIPDVISVKAVPKSIDEEETLLSDLVQKYVAYKNMIMRMNWGKTIAATLGSLYLMNRFMPYQPTSVIPHIAIPLATVTGWGLVNFWQAKCLLARMDDAYLPTIAHNEISKNKWETLKQKLPAKQATNVIDQILAIKRASL